MVKKIDKDLSMLFNYKCGDIILVEFIWRNKYLKIKKYDSSVLNVEINRCVLQF